MPKIKGPKRKSQRPKYTRNQKLAIKEQKVFKAFYKRHDVSIDVVISLLRDIYKLCGLTIGSADCRRDEEYLTRRYKAEGLTFITKILPTLFDGLVQQLEHGTASYPTFRLVTKKGVVIPAFLHRITSKVVSSLDSKNHEKTKVRTKHLKHVYQLCYAFKKLKGPYHQSVLRKQLADFIQVDADLNKNNWRDPAFRAIRKQAKKTITSVLKGLDPDDQVRDFIPRPGPGSTNTPREKHERFRPHVLYTTLNEQFPYEDWFYSHPWDIVDEPKMHPFKLPKVYEPTSRFKFVPKTFCKPRGICIEEFEVQYLQQGMKNALVKRIETHPITSGFVNFADQKVNQQMALAASVTNDWATIDMSDASDRVARDLVEVLFEGNQAILEKLLALSTREITFPVGCFIDSLKVNKYAPMGSALCFPVMALVHFALIQAIIDLNRVPQDGFNRICTYVYGDDIIIPKMYVRDVFELLPNFGMKLNEQKSFYSSSHFRESCGVHAFNGVDICPTFIRVLPLDKIGIRDLYSLRGVESQLFQKGYQATAEMFRNLIIKVAEPFGVKFMPAVLPESPVFGWIRTQSDATLRVRHQRLKRRWSETLLCYEYRALVVSIKFDQLPPLKQNEAYLKWFTLGDDKLGLELSEITLTSETDALKQHELLLSQIEHLVQGIPISFHMGTKWLPESALRFAA